MDIKKIVAANDTIRSDVDDYFCFRFTDITVGMPYHEHMHETRKIMPQECRIRDMTYSAPICCKVEYTKGNRRCDNGGEPVLIGHMPMMLGSSNCWLSDMNHE